MGGKMDKKSEELLEMVDELTVEGYASCDSKTQRRASCPSGTHACAYDCANGWSFWTPDN